MEDPGEMAERAPPDFFESPYSISDFKVVRGSHSVAFRTQSRLARWDRREVSEERRNQKQEVKRKMKSESESESERYDMIRYSTEAKENYALVAHGAEGFRVYYQVQGYQTSQAPR